MGGLPIEKSIVFSVGVNVSVVELMFWVNVLLWNGVFWQYSDFWG